jgi:superfamily II DNA or RNA helicase
VSEKAIARYDERADREILGELVGVEATSASHQLTFAEGPTHRFALSRAACARLFPLLGKTGRFRLRQGSRAGPGEVPIVWQEREWSFRLKVTVAPPAEPGAEAPWDVRGVLRSDTIEVPLGEVEALFDGPHAIARGRLARVDDRGASSWFGMLVTHRSVRITPARRAAFLEELYGLPSPPLELPDGFALPVVDAEARPRLVVHPPHTASSASLLGAELSFSYDGLVVPARRAGRVAFDGAHTRLVRRDAELEAMAASRLAELGVEPLSRAAATSFPEGSHLGILPARLPNVVAALLADAWQVEALGRKHRSARAWRTSVRSGVDWLDLEGEIAFDGYAIPLPRVLDALRRGESFVVLDDGSLGVIPEKWLARYGIVLRLGAAHDGCVRFTPSQLPLLDALASVEPEIRVDAAFERARADAAAAKVDVPLDPPASFKGELRCYQRTGLGWMRALERVGLGGLLADEMGLGKTVQVLAHLAGRPRLGKPSLVVAPRSLLFNWKREVARFAPGLRLLDHTGPDRRAPGPHFGDHDLVLTTYGTLRRDADALVAIAFDYVVLDEAQAIKNDTSDTARAARRLTASRRLALSGTPVENHLGELWSIVEFLNPGLLGRASAWKSVTEANPSSDAVAIVGRAIEPILLRRTKVEVAPDLPARLEETWMCELEGPERELYEELRARFRSEILGNDRREHALARPARVLEALLRLRQAACHPGLLDPKRRAAKSAKLEALLPRLASLRENGQKALVFSQFRALLDLTRPLLEAAGIPCAQLDGTTEDREGMVARFQDDPTCGVLLVSLKAGGVGLNLTAAEYVFLLDPWWNPAAEAQAIDRAHRIGQTKPVFAYRLIARDTVEERIAELQHRKRLLAESVIRGDGATLSDLSLEDLDRLFS